MADDKPDTERVSVVELPDAVDGPDLVFLPADPPLPNIHERSTLEPGAYDPVDPEEEPIVTAVRNAVRGELESFRRVVLSVQERLDTLLETDSADRQLIQREIRGARDDVQRVDMHLAKIARRLDDMDDRLTALEAWRLEHTDDGR